MAVFSPRRQRADQKIPGNYWAYLPKPEVLILAGAGQEPRKSTGLLHARRFSSFPPAVLHPYPNLPPQAGRRGFSGSSLPASQCRQHAGEGALRGMPPILTPDGVNRLLPTAPALKAAGL